MVSEERQLTYRELERRADRLGCRLRTLGITQEARVGVFVERSPELLVGLLAILKAGVPTSPSTRSTLVNGSNSWRRTRA